MKEIKTEFEEGCLFTGWLFGKELRNWSWMCLIEEVKSVEKTAFVGCCSVDLRREFCLCFNECRRVVVRWVIQNCC